MVGGDLAYDNGFKACYRRWDYWFNRWHELSTTYNGGFSIPLVVAIGNHESGGFGASPGDDPYYTPYFPQQPNLHNVEPKKRPAYHSHRISNNSMLIVLDSDVITRIADQADWLEEQFIFAENDQRKVKFVVYHGNIYPSIMSVGSIGSAGKKYWTPLFDKYNATAVFENHWHVYKRTKPLRGDKESDDGITYFGDGAWGVQGTSRLGKYWYLEEVLRKQHFYAVTVSNSKVVVDAFGVEGEIFDSWSKVIL